MTVREDGKSLVDDPLPVSADELLELDFEEEPPRHTHEGVNTRRVDTVTRFNLLEDLLLNSEKNLVSFLHRKSTE